MATATWRTYPGHDGMRPPKFHPNRSIGRRVIALSIFCNMAAVRHLENEFCYSGPPTKHEVNYAVRLPRQNLVSIRYFPPEILRFYNFATLAGKCLTTPPFWGFQGYDLGGVARKKSITRTGQDRTIKKAQKRKISHIWGKLPVKILQWNLEQA